jgi:hypothetical protein
MQTRRKVSSKTGVACRRKINTPESSPRCSRSTTLPRKFSLNDSDEQQRLAVTNPLQAAGTTPSPKKRANHTLPYEYLTLWQNDNSNSVEADDHQVVKKGRGCAYGTAQDQPPKIPPRRPIKKAQQNDEMPSLTCGTNGMKKGHASLHRQGAISYDSSGPREQQSLESIMDSSVVQGPPRRPTSLTHQSVSSSHGFSVFGSVDSEQSVPRTAPLATPEQDMSLLDVSSVENLPLEQTGCLLTEQQSLDGIGMYPLFLACS